MLFQCTDFGKNELLASAATVPNILINGQPFMDLQPVLVENTVPAIRPAASPREFRFGGVRLLHRLGLLACCAMLALSTANLVAQDLLLNVTDEEVPNDLFPDEGTTVRIVQNQALGGRALEIKFEAGGAVGDKPAAVADWTPFTSLEFTAFNPSQKPLAVSLNVYHAETEDFGTRVVHEFQLKPKLNSVSIPLAKLKNTNRSKPALGDVVKWTLAVDEGPPVTLLIGDIRLVGGTSPTGRGPQAAEGAPERSGPPQDDPEAAGDPSEPPEGEPAPEREESVAPQAVLPFLTGSFRVRGTVGDLEVDLVITPLGAEEAPEPEGSPAEAEMEGAEGPGPSADAGPERADSPSGPGVSQAEGPGELSADWPIMFDTPEADAILSQLEVFPPDNHWNVRVDDWPTHPMSDKIVGAIGADKPLRANSDMNFILVNSSQPRIDVELEITEESDPGPYPVPDNTPIELWPVNYLGDDEGDFAPITLEDLQRDARNEGGDRHAIVIDVDSRQLFEFYQMKMTDNGWFAGGAAIFDLTSNALRPERWTSADAAGLPIFPGVVRYDELQRGEIKHALRVTVPRTRKAYIYPARHFASEARDPSLPRMGERLRLRSDFDLAPFSPDAQVILTALKTYGMFVVDNGIEWAISTTPDSRMPNIHQELRRVTGADFEVVSIPEGFPRPE